MKRVLWLLLALALLLCGCGIFPTSPQEEAARPELPPPEQTESDSAGLVPLPQGTAFDYQHYDWASMLLADAFTPGTSMGDAALAKIQLQVESVTDSTLTLSVSAPQIGDSLWDWYAAQQPENAAVEEKILSLLTQTAPTTGSFTLSYRVGSDGIPKVDYTAAYGCAVSCGLTDFYYRLQQDFITELEGSMDG